MIKAYKGFDKDLKCRGFQYEIGKQYTEEKAELCESGFHACEYPLDVFGYYDPTNSFCEVEIDEVPEKKKNDGKICGRKIKIGAEIGLRGMIEASVKFIFEKVDWDNAKKSNTGDYSAATNTGDYSAATNTGDYSAATNTGNRSAATNTGDQSAATNTGDYSVATNTGYQSAATNTGDYSAATNTGDYSAATNTGYQSAATNTGTRSAATNTGDYSAATNTGDYSAATNTGTRSAAVVEGEDSVAMAMGIESKAKGAKGCWIVLAEWGQDDNGDWHIKTMKSKKVDGKTIKVDTFYTLENGKFVESE